MLLHCLVGHADETRRRGIDLKAAASAAGTLRAVHIQHGMTQLCAREIRAGIDLAVDDDTAADARSQRDADCVRSALCCARNVLAVSSRICVILHKCRSAGRLGNPLDHRDIVEIEVIGILNDAGHGIRDARRTNADPLDLLRCQSALADRIQCAGCHICRNLLCGTRTVGLAGDLPENVVILVNQSGDDVRAAEINTNIIFHNVLRSGFYSSSGAICGSFTLLRSIRRDVSR